METFDDQVVVLLHLVLAYGKAPMSMQGRSQEEEVDTGSLPKQVAGAFPSTVPSSESGSYVKGNALERAMFKLDARNIVRGRSHTIFAPKEQWPYVVESLEEHLGVGWQSRYPNCTLADPDVPENSFTVSIPAMSK